MNKMSAALLVITMILCAPTFAGAQTNSSLPDRVAKAIKEREPKWELKSTDHVPSERDGFIFSSYLWEDGNKSFVESMVIISNSPEQGAEWFKFLEGEFAVPGARHRLTKGSVTNLGVDNYLWEDYYDSVSGGVTFKQGNVVARVGSSSKATAERFAFHILEVIKNIQ